MSILIKGVSKHFGSFKALDNVSLEVPDGDLLALLGPSGSGKTTLLRIIAGLEVADTGSVLNQDEDITHHSARDRKVGFVFQHYALFRHMTVAENIGYGLKVRKTPKAQIRARVDELLKLIRLDGFGNRYPSQLSGGQRQRVALARALAAQPRVLLLDEPFGALDAKVRQELRQWLRRLHEDIHVTSIFVTHDQEEAFEVANTVVVMNEGKIEQTGSPDEVYHHPASPFVYRFLGNVNLFHGRIDDGRAHIHEKETGHVVYVRPHLLDIDRIPNGGDHFRARIKHINSAGALVKVEAITDWGTLVNVEISQDRFRTLQLIRDETVFVIPKDVKVFNGHNEKLAS